MRKAKKIEAEFQLPDVIIQHIQSFLDGKQAAQTAILSKLWYNAWLTRPNLDFNEDHFLSSTFGYNFWEFLRKNVERYEKLNLKIESLKLHVRSVRSSLPEKSINEVITKTIKMGASAGDLCFCFGSGGYRFVLPHEVLEFENLTRLCLSGCKIILGADGKVSCSRLKHLSLNNVDLEDDVLRNIISVCPSIENLTLSSDLALRQFIAFGKRIVTAVVDHVPIIVYELHNLTCLVLSGVNVHTMFFDDLSSKFPWLKDLSLRDCGGYKGINISNPTLECISFIQEKMLRAKFDVPSIRKFTYSGPVPSLLFKRTSSNWESHIYFCCSRPPSSTWWLKLNKLLTALSLSKVFLSPRIGFKKSFDCAELNKGSPKPEVENLAIDCVALKFAEFFYSLFRCCRPIYVTQPYCIQPCSMFHKWGMFDGWNNHNFMNYVYKRVQQEVTSSMSGECVLEEVDVEFFDEAVSAWRPQLLDASTGLGPGKERIRLHLRWRR